MVCKSCKGMKKGKKTRCWKGYAPVKGKKPYSKGSCRRVKRKGLKSRSIKIGRKEITYKKGALRKQMGFSRSQKFTKSGLNRLSKIPMGRKFVVGKKRLRMTPLLKRRIVFGRTLMRMRKK